MNNDNRLLLFAFEKSPFRLDFYLPFGGAKINGNAKVITHKLLSVLFRKGYGGKLPTYIKGSILDEDIICPTGIDDKKVILFDDFTCIDSDGVHFTLAKKCVVVYAPPDER